MMKEHKYKSKVILIFLLFFLSIIELHPHNFFTSPQENWTAYVLYVKDGKVPVLKNPSDEADTISFVYYRDKVLIVEEVWQKFGWKKIVYPINGFINENSLMTYAQKIDLDKRFDYSMVENDYSNWEWEKVPCSASFAFVKEKMDQSSANLGLIKENDEILIIRDQPNYNSIWVKTVYPFSGYINFYKAFREKKKTYLAIGISYGVKHIPYEKNLKNFFNPLGGYVEFSKTNWNLGIRLGYNYSQSRLSTFHLKTNQVYLNLVYRFIGLFNKKLELYALTGANYWFANFQNTKYGAEIAYFKLERDSGPGYHIGGGVIYNLGNLYIETQYIFFGSNQAKFGKEPALGEFANYNILNPGANHFGIIIGYKFTL